MAQARAFLVSLDLISLGQPRVNVLTDTATIPAVLFSPQNQSTVAIETNALLGLDERFEVLELLGQGGLCVVLRCYDHRLEREVALKRLRPNESKRQSDWDRFMMEPQILAKLSGPCLPKIFDTFPERMYKPYFTMEVIEGFDLCRVLSGLRNRMPSVEQSFTLERLVRLIASAAQGMQAAHDAGIIHRDIKPENMMLNVEGELRIVDWGIALQDNPGSADSNRDAKSDRRQTSSETERRANRLTQQDQMWGTPLYMSPEHIRTRGEVDHRADIFSLGAVLYDCLALTPLIQGVNRAQVFRYTLAGDYQSPSKIGFRDFVPSDLETVCMRAVAAEADQRFQSMNDFSDALLNAI